MRVNLLDISLLLQRYPINADTKELLAIQNNFASVNAAIPYLNHISINEKHHDIY